MPGGLTVDRGALRRDPARTCSRVRRARAGAGARERPARHGDGWTVARGDDVLRCPLPGRRERAPAPARRRRRRRPRRGRWRCTPCGAAATRAATAADARSRRWPRAGCGERICPAARFGRWRSSIPRRCARTGGDARRLYRRLLAGSRAVRRRWPRTAGPAAGVQACDATSYAVATPIDERAVRVGEAAFAIDPLSSSGVQTAIQTGLAAAAAVHSILAPDGDRDAAIEYYGAHQRHAVARHAATAAALYAEHRPHATGASGAGAAPAPPAPSQPPVPAAAIAELLAARVSARARRRRCATRRAWSATASSCGARWRTPASIARSRFSAATSSRRCSTSWPLRRRWHRRSSAGTACCRPVARTRSPAGCTRAGCSPPRRDERAQRSVPGPDPGPGCSSGQWPCSSR